MNSNLNLDLELGPAAPADQVQGYTEMILDRKLGPISEGQERGLKVALRNAGRLLGLIDNLLDYAKLMDGQVMLATKRVDLREVLMDLRTLMRHNLHRYGIEFKLISERGGNIVEGGGTANWPLRRRLLSRWGNAYTRAVLGIHVRDCTAGFRRFVSQLRRLLGQSQQCTLQDVQEENP